MTARARTLAAAVVLAALGACRARQDEIVPMTYCPTPSSGPADAALPPPPPLPAQPPDEDAGESE
jgi:hypothetical protein